MNRHLCYIVFALVLLIAFAPVKTRARGVVQQESKRPKIATQSQQKAVAVETEDRTPPITRIEGAILKMEVNGGRMTLWMSIGDENLEPLPGLQMENYRIIETVNGVVREVPMEAVSLKTEAGEYPFITALLRDVSSSLNAHDFKQVNRAMTAYIDRMLPGQIAALIDFGTHITTRHRFTTNRRALKNALRKRVSQGATAFYDGLWKAVSDLEKVPHHRSMKIIIVFTDGGDNHSTHSLQQVLHAAKSAAIPIFCIGMGGVQEGVLRQIADETHGLYFHAPTAESLTPVYEKIAALLTGMYVVSFPTSAKAGDTVSVEASVRYSAGKKQVTNQFGIDNHQLR